MIIFLYGAETFLSRRKLKELKAKFIADVDQNSQSVSVIDGAASNWKSLSEKINTGSLFVKKRLVVLENVFQNKQTEFFVPLRDYLKKINARRDKEDNVIIFWEEELNTKNKPLPAAAKKLFEFLNQQEYVQEFKTLNAGQVLAFIKNETAAYGREIGAGAARRLLDLTGGNLWTLSKEIKKLALSAEGKTITPETVRETVAGSFSEDIFSLTDALSAKNRSLALELLEKQYRAGSSPEYVLTMLIRQFKILLQIRSALDEGLNPVPVTLANKLKLHPFVVKKTLLSARDFSAAGLKNYFNRLIHLDYLNKSGRADLKTELALLISRL